MKKGVFLAFLLASTLLLIGLPSVSAFPKIPHTPIGKTINVVSNETFVLAFEMEFNEPDPGFFIVTYYWDCRNLTQLPNTAPAWNFTYEGFVCKFTDGTPIPEAYYIPNPPYYGPNYTRYWAQFLNPDTGIAKDGQFWLNITMRAAGVVNGSCTPHAGGNQTLAFSPKLRVRELNENSTSGKCTIHVTPRILSCNSTGAPKEVFSYDEDAYVKGFGFPNSTTSTSTRLYVVPNATWTDGQPIGSDVRGAYSTAIVDSAGNMTATNLGKLPAGELDIVADVNMNGIYNGSATDAVDDATSAPGVIIVGVHDVAVISVTPSAKVVSQGMAVNVTVLAENEGGYKESFNVTAYYGNATGNYTIERQLVTSLAAGMEKSLNLTWNTAGVPQGNYTILAQASIVSGENDTADNTKVDGNVTVFIPLIHDVAVINVTASPTRVYPAQIVYINVTVKNNGDFYESFNVTAYYGSAAGNYTIEVRTVTNLAMGANANLTFQWNVTGVFEGIYIIYANASIVPGEVDTADNIKMDGVVIMLPLVITQARITLINIRTVNIYVNATFQKEITLKVRFYSYTGELQEEATLWSGAAAHVTLSMDITLPQGNFVEIVELVLFEDGRQVSIVDLFIVSQSVLATRRTELQNLWTVPGANLTVLFREMVAIDAQWPYAPS